MLSAQGTSARAGFRQAAAKRGLFSRNLYDAAGNFRSGAIVGDPALLGRSGGPSKKRKPKKTLLE